MQRDIESVKALAALRSSYSTRSWPRMKPPSRDYLLSSWLHGWNPPAGIHRPDVRQVSQRSNQRPV